MSLARYGAAYAETTPGTFPGSPTAVPIRLVGDDAHKIYPEVGLYAYSTLETNNRILDEESSRLMLKGKISTYLYPEQATFWLGLALTLDANGELGSFATQFFDGIAYQRNLGLYVEQLQLKAAPEQEEGLWKMDIDVLGMLQGTAPTSGTFPVIAGTAYPTTNPFKFIETKAGASPPAAGFTLDTGSATRTKYNDLSITIKNELSANFDESSTATDVTFHGRRITLEAGIRYLSNADRALYEARTPLNMKVVMAKGTTPSAKRLTLDFKGKNKFNKIDPNLSLGKPSYNKIVVTNFFDPSSGVDTDMSFAYTAAV